MKISSVQFKAAFLLIVFSLSTVVGFACSVGLDKTFNADHHKETVGQQQNSHEHGESHEHTASADHHREPVSHHGPPADHHKQVSNSQESPDDNCCKDEVAKFEKSEKRIPPSFNNLQPPLAILPFNTPFNINVLISYLHKPSNKYFVRNHHPPIADTRIAIQSFLI